MGKLKSERHHWWPECVSKHWADQEGGVHWLRPNGSTTRSTPNNFGVIRNGHHIKFRDDACPWGESFERAFQTADENFPEVISWLNALPHIAAPDKPVASRLVTHNPTDEQFSRLIECLVSLAVRSPMFRNAAANTAEYFRGPIESKERNAIIGLNIRQSLMNALKQIRGSGKAMVVFSPDREFIFGDGFFSNLTPPADHLLNPKMFVPLTPRMAVLFTRPPSYRVAPRLVTCVVSPTEVDALNLSVHVYAKDAIYYRSERPVMTDHFAQANHLVYSDHHNPIDQLIQQIPGIPGRDAWLDALFEGEGGGSLSRRNSAPRSGPPPGANGVS